MMLYVLILLFLDFFFQILCLVLDEVFSVMVNRLFVKFFIEEQSKVEISLGMIFLLSFLLEINCLLLLLQLLVSCVQIRWWGNISYVEVIEVLLIVGFYFIGFCMVFLGVVEVVDCVKLYSGCFFEDWKFYYLVGIFVIFDNFYFFYVNFF